jgi:acetylornithine deacetylase/succinyl-diaminopimelate desuccinylase-like protein
MYGDRLFSFPFKLNDTTRMFFLRAAETESPQTAADMRAIVTGPELETLAITRLSANPFYNAQLRTTCVATQLEGGHAVNALPQMARATVNRRVLPGEPIAKVEATLKRVLADDQISITLFGMPGQSPPFALHGEVMAAIGQLSAEFWPGVPAPEAQTARICAMPTYLPTAIRVSPTMWTISARTERTSACL